MVTKILTNSNINGENKNVVLREDRREVVWDGGGARDWLTVFRFVCLVGVM